MRRDFDDAFQAVDAIVCPTSPTPAFRLGEKMNDPLQMYLADIFTVPANLAGVPGLSLPCGMVDGLPAGLQLVGRPFDEATMSVDDHLSPDERAEVEREAGHDWTADAVIEEKAGRTRET